jgi:alanyl-tRNA synthetase
VASFGEKYENEIRVVSMGKEFGKESIPYSVELCGGTHVHYTGDIGYFKIVSESSIAVGVRRIEAFTGPNAVRYALKQGEQLREVSQLLKSSPLQIYERILHLMDERKRLEKDLKLSDEKWKESELSGIKEISGIKFYYRELNGMNVKELRSIADQMKKEVGSGIVAVATIHENRTSLVVGVTDDLVPALNAINFVKISTKIIGGKGGGGRPDLAQTGGPKINNLKVIYDAIENEISQSIKK